MRTQLKFFSRKLDCLQQYQDLLYDNIRLQPKLQRFDVAFQLYTFKFSIEYMNKQHENMSGSNPLYPQESSKINLESQSQSNSKTVTRFPPISKTKTDQTPNLKENVKEASVINTASRKFVEEPTGTSFKKTNPNIKKRGDKKKAKLVEIKPEVMEKYKQYSDFSNLANLSNNLRVQVTEKLPNYVLYVGKGNNSSLIKTIFRNYRPWWTIEELNPTNPNVNMFWFQLRQNDILDNFKENIKSEADFQHCDYYIDQTEEKQEEEAGSTKMSSKSQFRSQSVTQKDIKSTGKLNLSKRSSSRTKGVSNEKGNTIPQALFNLGKDVKDEIEMQGQGKKKKTLVNPKMWPIYNNYRKLFSHSEVKQLKKLKVIDQSGAIQAKISRNKIKYYENRSNYFRIHNHLTNNWNLSNKKALFMNLKNYYDAQKINPFEFIPMTFHVTQMSDKEFLRFQEEFDKRSENLKQEEKKQKNQQFKHVSKPKKRNAWLVKPGENTNRGTGIEVVQTIQEIKEIIQRDKVDKMGRARTHIIQEYIMPFLYQKRKFDIRSYICVTSINGYQKGYWYQDGYIRTASKEFNMKNLNNKFIHLTNDAVQKYHEDYGKFEPANKLSFADFQRYLDAVHNSNSENGNKLKFFQQAYPEMKKLAADAIRSVYSKMNSNKKEFSFEIFGLDFLIDEGFKVWLIEANTNPCLQLACPLLGRIIPSMLENAFKIVIDPIYPPPPIEDLVSLTKKQILPQNPLENNKFQLIFDEAEQGRELKAIMSNAPAVKILEVQQQQEQQYDENYNECAKGLCLD